MVIPDPGLKAASRLWIDGADVYASEGQGPLARSNHMNRVFFVSQGRPRYRRIGEKKVAQRLPKIVFRLSLRCIWVHCIARSKIITIN